MSLTALMSGLDLAAQAAKRPWKVHKIVLSLLHQHCRITVWNNNMQHANEDDVREESLLDHVDARCCHTLHGS